MENLIDEITKDLEVWRRLAENAQKIDPNSFDGPLTHVHLVALFEGHNRLQAQMARLLLELHQKGIIDP